MKKIIFCVAICCTAIIGFEVANASSSESATSTERIIVHGSVKCNKCNGTGIIRKNKPHAPCEGDGCEACDWKGYKSVTEECPKCKGDGSYDPEDR